MSETEIEEKKLVWTRVISPVSCALTTWQGLLGDVRRLSILTLQKSGGEGRRDEAGGLEQSYPGPSPAPSQAQSG